jgi:ABC-type glutathione transport system ATPase component
METGMKNLILIRGLSGSGKTTLADLIVGDDPNKAEVCADDFFIDESGVYKFEFEKLKEAHQWCQEECRQMMEEGVETIVVHNTFTRKWECEPYFKIAENGGYEVTVVSLYDGGCSDSALQERCVHGLSLHQISEQRKRWDLNVYPHRTNRPRSWKEPPQQMVAVPASWLYDQQRGGHGNPPPQRKRASWKSSGSGNGY